MSPGSDSDTKASFTFHEGFIVYFTDFYPSVCGVYCLMKCLYFRESSPSAALNYTLITALMYNPTDFSESLVPVVTMVTAGCLVFAADLVVLLCFEIRQDLRQGQF